MARFEIEITRTAENKLRALPRQDQERLAKAMIGLAEDPCPRGSRKLSGYDDVYRIRVGRYRVIYSLSHTKLIILILKIGHRSDVYR